ncbi:hypothetical protein [Pseudomonas leptonychotis]|uniref:hypothetical protein n=1 Tax=Pseudomonas leptonychotis TaxID=2448482 RepID=UPI0038689E4E
MATFYRTLRDASTGYCYLYTYEPGSDQRLRRIAEESEGLGDLVSGVVMTHALDGSGDRVIYVHAPSADKDSEPPPAAEVHRFTQALMASYSGFFYSGSAGGFLLFYARDTSLGVTELVYFLVSPDGELREYRLRQLTAALTPMNIASQSYPNSMIKYSDGSIRFACASGYI